jgi:endogenous inhibitor of DNA gyrase (YacG/DUF329 family)
MSDMKCETCGKPSGDKPVCPECTEKNKVLDDVLNRWAGTDGTEIQRMRHALLRLSAFEVDYRRVRAGGKQLVPIAQYPLPLP